MSNTPAFAESDFRKASASNPDRECVRVARRDGWVEIRDDKKIFGAPDDHRLLITEEQFDNFLASIRSGDTNNHYLEMTRHNDGIYTLRLAGPPAAHATELEFTEAEVSAFLDGIRGSEFDRPAYAASGQR